MDARLLRQAAAGLALAAVALIWMNTRIDILRTNQSPAKPAIYDTYHVFHLMAMALRDGRIGQIDLAALRLHESFGDPAAPYQRLPPDAPHEWVHYYTLDIGYSFIVEAARLAFHSLPDNHLRSVALQIVVDAILVAFVFFVFSHWNFWLGFAAAALYSLNLAARFLVSVAFYYYWDFPVAFVALGSLMLARRRPAEAGGWLALSALTLGFGVWLRSSWWPLSVFLFALAASVPELRRRLVLPVLMFALLAVPQAARASLARHRPALSTRAVWHVALVGLGYLPNSYGLELSDNTIFKMTHDKYGVVLNIADYEVHDQAARTEFLSIWRKDPGFVLRSFRARLRDSIVGAAESPSYAFISNPAYRLLCFAGLVLMLWYGGEQRFVAIAAGGTYAIYVLLTCLFYYVGLPYDNVTQVTLLILFLGGLDVALHVGGQMRADRPGDRPRDMMAFA
jgi:hypothetical protein